MIFCIFVLLLITFSSAGIYSYLADSYQMTAHKLKVVDSSLSTYTLEENILNEEKEFLLNDNENIDTEISSLQNSNTDLMEQRLSLQESMNADTTGTVNWYQSIGRCNADINSNNSQITELRNTKKTNIDRVKQINEELKVV